MTAPNFGSINPPQFVRPGKTGGESLGEFAEFLVSIADRREQRKIQREGLDLDRRRVESAEAMDKLTRKKYELEFEDRENRMAANEAVDRYVGEALLNPDLSPGALSQIRARMVAENDKKLAPFLNEAFDSEFNAQQQTLSGIATRRTAESNARVAGATEGNRVRGAQLDVDAAEIEVQNRKLENTFLNLRNAGFDAARLSAAREVAMASDQPWGVVRKQFGLPAVRGGIPDNFVFPNPQRGTQSTSDQLGAGMAGMIGMINEIGNDKGLSPMAFRSITSGPLEKSAINSLLSEDQQHLVSAYSPFIATMQAIAVKGAASDSDVSRLQNAYVTLESDRPSVKQQKAILRNALMLNFADVKDGGYERALSNFMATAKRLGVCDSALLQPFISLGPGLRQADSAARAGAAQPMERNDAIINGVITQRRGQR